MADVRCPGCGLAHPDRGLPAPRGLAATGECHAEYGTVLAAFYTPALVSLRQYVVDAYAGLHPDPLTRQGVQTTALCLMTMDLYFECGQPVADGSTMHQEMMRTRPTVFERMDPPATQRISNQRLLLDAPAARYPDLARVWARVVWDAWASNHEQVRAWNELLVPHRVASPPPVADRLDHPSRQRKGKGR